ncbi:hypothetical protein [Mucilaginibacter xinganensis]|uniref:LITAF domain-containing protein n=1 Tax=Mucilaginibacter xinganensis TaxID=1234841 RepID=A0A223NV82_9SPHI|nr:hypothetical protein [Mucilaginibacter xinganensis]ASU33767.1 hypothetical protein MuYL_1871 [Mucilaginibacter xinganensis]
MEKIDTTKRYNLKLPVDPGKPAAPAKKCPECKSRNIKIKSRRRYFLKSALCALIVLPYWLLLVNLKEEDIPEPPATIMLVLLLILSFLLAGYGLYCCVMSVVIKQTSYRCRYCKSRFHTPVLEM